MHESQILWQTSGKYRGEPMSVRHCQFKYVKVPAHGGIVDTADEPSWLKVTASLSVSIPKTIRAVGSLLVNQHRCLHGGLHGPNVK